MCFVVAASISACAPAAPHRAPPTKPVSTSTSDAGSPSASSQTAPGQDVPSLEILAARGPSDAPQMREVLRVPEATAKPSDLKSTAADGCFRALVAASVPVRAWFEDEAKSPRGEIAQAAGLVPPRGPACARKGETLRLVVEPSSSSTSTSTSAIVIARAVVWQAP